MFRSRTHTYIYIYVYVLFFVYKDWKCFVHRGHLKKFWLVFNCFEPKVLFCCRAVMIWNCLDIGAASSHFPKEWTNQQIRAGTPKSDPEPVRKASKSELCVSGDPNKGQAGAVRYLGKKRAPSGHLEKNKCAVIGVVEENVCCQRSCWRKSVLS